MALLPLMVSEEMVRPPVQRAMEGFYVFLDICIAKGSVKLNMRLSGLLKLSTSIATLMAKVEYEQVSDELMVFIKIKELVI